jgi:hypothetical protein
MEEALPIWCAAPRTDDVEAVFLLPAQHLHAREALLAVRVEELYDFGGAELMPACRCISGRWWRGGWHAVGLERGERGIEKMPPERDTPAGAFRLSIRKIGCSMNKSGTGTLWGLPAGNAAFVLF